MQNLIPHFIHTQFSRNITRGDFVAATMFVDVSGFTTLTESLMQHETDGAEIVAAALNRVLNSSVAEVYAHGGFIATFAGDAFTALFPSALNAAQHALQTARFIQDFFAQHSVLETKYGRFEIDVKVGLSYGEVTWGIVGEMGRYTYFFRGPAITGCAQAEHQARTGDVIADDRIHPHITKDAAEAYALEAGHYYRLALAAFKPRLPRFAPPSLLMRNDLAPFVLDAASDLVISGAQAEFRRVAALFISFDVPVDHSTLNTFVSDVLALMSDYGGYFNKLDFGDKGGMMLVLFGAPVAHENDLERAGNFLLALQGHNAPVAWRAGLAFGPVYAGLVGGTVRCEYTAIGNIVNFASRLTQKAAWGQILVPETVASHSAFQTHAVGEIHYKGFSQPRPTYALLSSRTAAGTFFDQAMVGRQRELAHLVKAAQPLFAGKFAGVAYIYGEAGIGKSCLAHELHHALRQHSEITWFIGQTDQILRQAFNPFVYVLKRYFDQSPEATPDESKARFDACYARLLTNLRTIVGQDVTRIQPLIDELIRTRSTIGALLDLHWPGSLYESLDAELRYQNTLIAVKTWLLAESCFQPVVLLIEDLHWLDSASHALLTTLTRNVADAPLLILVTSRYADDGSKPTLTLSEDIPVTALDLNALSRTELQTLSQTILGHSLSADLSELLLARTQANPFFVQQLLYYFRESNLLLLDPETQMWAVKADVPANIPTTIQAILIARLDRLSQAVKKVVKSAAVLGREFDVQVLRQMLHTAVIREVRTAECEQIWSEVQRMRYLFKHILMRDTAYAMQLRRHRRELHQRAAEALEALYADELAQYYADLSYHYENAGVVDKALTYLHKAGDFAKEVYALEEATSYYQKALALLVTAEGDKAEAARQRVLLYESLSEILLWQAQLAEAQTACIAMRSAAEATGDLAAQARAWNKLGTMRERLGDYHAALDCAKRAETVARAVDVPAEVARALTNQGFAFFRMGDMQQSLALSEQSLTLSTEFDIPNITIGNLNLLGGIHDITGNYNQAVHYLEQSLALCRALDNRWRIAGALNNLGENARLRGDYRAAVAHFQEAVDICREIGHRSHEMLFLSTLGGARVGLGQYKTAEVEIRQAIQMSQATGELFSRAYSYLFLAEALLGQERYQDALKAAQQSLSLGQQINLPEVTGGAWCALGKVALRLSGPITMDERGYTAPTCFAESQRIFEEVGAEGEQARTLRAWATYELTSGNQQQGQVMWSTARGLFARLDMTLEVERMDCERPPTCPGECKNVLL